jgi:hypothetical protein
MSAFLKTFHNAGECWSKPILDNRIFNRRAIPFHVLLNMSPHEDSSHRIFTIARELGIPLRND